MTVVYIGMSLLLLYAISSIFGVRLFFNGSNEVYIRETFKYAIWIGVLLSIIGFTYICMFLLGKVEWNVKELKLSDSDKTIGGR